MHSIPRNRLSSCRINILDQSMRIRASDNLYDQTVGRCKIICIDCFFPLPRDFASTFGTEWFYNPKLFFISFSAHPCTSLTLITGLCRFSMYFCIARSCPHISCASAEVSCQIFLNLLNVRILELSHHGKHVHDKSGGAESRTAQHPLLRGILRIRQPPLPHLPWL